MSDKQVDVDDSDMGTTFRAMRDAKRKRHDQRLRDLAPLLLERGAKQCSEYHFKIRLNGKVYDLWPSSDKYMVDGKVSNGIRRLLGMPVYTVETPLRSVTPRNILHDAPPNEKDTLTTSDFSEFEVRAITSESRPTVHVRPSVETTGQASGSELF